MLWRFILLLAILAISLTLNLCLGDVSLSPQQVLSALTGQHAGSSGAGLAEILWQIRLPRILIAFMVGVGLAASGYVLQALSRNPLADPYLTGTSSGAGLAVAIAMLAGLDFSFVPAAALAGGLIASICVALMARSSSGLSVSKLLLAGVAVSAICGSFITLCLVNAGDPAKSQGLFFWLAGGIAGRSWSDLAPAAAYTASGLALSLLFSKPLRLLALGAPAATSFGLDVTKAQSVLLLAAILMCGASVSVSGLVGFVGLIAPHLARRLFGRDERVHLISAALIGGSLVLFSDLAARTLAQGQELPLGTLLSLIGGPFFLWLVLQQHGEGF